MTHKEFAVEFLREFPEVCGSSLWRLIVFTVADAAFIWFLCTADPETTGLWGLMSMMTLIVIIPFLPSPNKDGEGTTEAQAAPVETTGQ